MFLEILKFLIYSSVIVLISKYILVVTLRKLAETLNLKPKTVGDIAGYATSMPELLTIGVSSFRGMMSASVVNVLSSNIINLIQYIGSIILNKNKKAIQNRAIQIDIGLVLATIIIPIILMKIKLEVSIRIVPIFLILYVLFRFLNRNAHKLYLEKEDKKLEKKIEAEERWERKNKKKMIRYISYLILTGIMLFIVGDLLGNTLENLCDKFGIPQILIGILLGFITSIPELITFFEAQKHYKKKFSKSRKDEENEILGVVEATNNLLTSNILNLFIIQSIGTIIYTLFGM